MERVLVRWSEIGTKSRNVKGRMINQLRDRVQERLTFEGIDHTIEPISGRLVVETADAETTAEAIGELPGVASTSPALACQPTTEAIAAASDDLDVGSSFGVDANVATDHPFDSRDLNELVGSRVQDRTGATVELDDPETWVEIDVRRTTAYLFTERIDGPDGYPVGVQRPLAALISGGIDSPVAAYHVMMRGADIEPIYFYNRPFASEDHLARFEESLRKLVRIHPGKQWGYHFVDLGEQNERLLEIDRGRMLLHRRLMFRTAVRIAQDSELAGLVTGESIGQKSSQTTANLEVTGLDLSLPVHRPLLTWSKHEITQAARRLGTFEEAAIPSACQSLAPESPATSMAPAEVDQLATQIDLATLVDRATESAEYRQLSGV